MVVFLDAKPQAATRLQVATMGNNITSRIVCVFVNNITKRSMPMPSPPAGGIPCRWARMKSWSIFAIESSAGSPASLPLEGRFLCDWVIQLCISVGEFHPMHV